MQNKGKKFLSDLKFYTDYSKWNEIDSKYERWDEACESVVDTHRVKYSDKLDILGPYIDEALEAYKEKIVTASQRNLQFRGKQILSKNERIYNCFEKNTEFITSEGVKSFNDFEYGDSCIVQTHTGSWKNAVVKKYGVQKLFRVTFSKGSRKEDVLVTKDHRWLLRKGVETTNLTIGDKILRPKNIFQDFNWETASLEEKIYWCYGLIYGDGTKVVSGNNTYSMIRLCGNNSKFEERFKQLGFKSTRPLSIAGDVMVYTGKYLKTTPNPSIDSPELIRAFVHGYLEANGEKNRNKTGKIFLSIQSSEIEHIDFIRKCFPVAGVFINNETDLTGQKTNYGTRPYTIKFHLTEGTNGSTDQHWVVTNIVEEKEDEVWCLEVEDDRSFILNRGIVTGNCSVIYLDKIESFHKTFYLTLCGCGVGVSMLKHWVDKLPDLKKRDKDVKNYIIPDSIEGWADAAGILISSYCSEGNVPFPEYRGCIVRFDYSQIRPKGAKISGGFKAPGPDGLKQSLERIEALLENEVKYQDSPKKFRSIIAYDVLMHLADATLSGGVRRAALSVIVDLNDDDMINAKTGEWRTHNKQRERSNNSVGLIRGNFTEEQFNELMALNQGMSDIGFCFLNNEYEVFNPCFTIDTKILTEDGWRTFGEILEITPNILQDNRVEGVLRDGKEEWMFDFYQSGCSTNKATRVAKTGENKEVFRLETVGGRVVKATKDHHFATTRGMITLGELEVGDEILVGVPDGYKPDHNSISFKEGMLAGHVFQWFRGDEVYDADYIPYLDEEKIKTVDLNYIHYKDKDYKSGFIKGFFYGLGEGTAERLESIRNIQLILQELGIFTMIEEEKETDHDFIWVGYFECLGKKNGKYSIQIKDEKSWENCKKIFGSDTISCKYKLKKDIEYKDTVKSIEFDSLQDVYCLEENNKRTLIAEGLTARRCFEIGMTPILDFEKEITGVEFCNLVSIIGSNLRTNGRFDRNKFKRAARCAGILGTLQAGYTDFPYLGSVTQDIVKKESLIGVSISGWMNSPELFDEELLKEGVAIIKQVNEEVSAIIGINPAARLTTSKPDGNLGALVGSASGIHPEHSRRYFRIMQINKETETARWLVENAGDMLEESEWSSMKTDYVVYIPIETNNATIYKDQMKGIKHLEKIAFVQKYWIEAGKVPERCILPTTRNSVSCTVIIDDYKSVGKYVYDNQDSFAAVSFLSDYGDKDYVQAPFTSVLSADELLEKYGDGVIFASGLIVDGLEYFEQNLWDACLHVKDKNKKIEGTRTGIILKKDWVRRAKQFSKNYFKGDLDKCIICLKDVHLFYKWCKINKSFKDVDFQSILKAPNYEDVSKYAAVACAGGKCDL